MLYEHLRHYGVSGKVIQVMNDVDRRLFVPEEYLGAAYDDTPLPIGHGQTISAPHMVGIMCQELELDVGLKVLEIGTGSGYNAAVIARLVGPDGKVYTIEVVSELAERARRRLEALGYANVQVIVGDGKNGLPEFAPFDRIVATCYARKILPALKEQLVDGGILLIPVGTELSQVLKKVRKVGGGFYESDVSFVRFVPMV